MKRRPAAGIAALLAILAGAACSATAGVKPVRSADPQVACPAGKVSWNLQVQDQRAELKDSEKLVGLVRSSLSQSFPACRWVTDPTAGTIGIEIHRFSAILDGSIWDAGADWSVSARDANGSSLTAFDATFGASRPNYRNTDNEREVLQQVFEQAIKKTVAGLQSLSSAP
jgi:hypothetical protein